MSYPIPQSNFVAGEISHRLKGRIDADQYGIGLEKARNFTILPQGPLRKRSGTGFITETKFQPGSNKETVQWITFRFNRKQSYAIEAGDLYFRLYTLRSRVLLSGSPYEIITPYTHDEVSSLQFKQINDVIYIVHKNHPVHKLIRFSEIVWTLAPVQYVDGPYLNINPTDTYITYSSLFKPSGTGAPVESFDGSDSTIGYFAGESGDYAYTFSGSNEYAVNGYSITYNGILDSGSFATSASRQPRTWTFQGKKAGSGTWVTLDAQRGEADWIPGETRKYSFSNKLLEVYNSYRVSVTAINGGAYVGIHEIALRMQDISGSFTFSSVVGVNNGAGLSSDDVGRYLRFQGPDGDWRYIIITSVSSTVAFNGKFYGTWFQGIGNTSIWRLGAFSIETGYPSCISLIDERLALASTAYAPRTAWLTETGDFESFIIPDPLTDTSPITVELTGEELDEILWLNSGKGLFVGTSSLVTSISPSGDGALTYKNVRQVQQTNHGAAPYPPIRIGPALLYQSSSKSCIRELIYNFSDDAYDAPNLTFLNEHFYKGMGGSIWLETPEDLVLTPNKYGQIVSMAYERAQKVYGSTAYETDGTFLSLCNAFNTEKEVQDVYVITRRIINGVEKQYVEFMYESFEEQELSEARLLDCCLEYQGAPASTFSGLSHLEGKTVFVVGYAGGETSLKVYERVVTSGSVTVDDALVSCYIGLNYTAYIEILPSRSAKRDGSTSFRSKQHVDSLSIDLYRSAGLSVSGDKGLTYEELIPRQYGGSMDQVPELLTGEANVPIESSWLNSSVIRIQSDKPMPAMIRLIMPEEDKED